MEKPILTPSDFLNDTVFIPPLLSGDRNLVLSVFQRNEFGKHELIGKVHSVYHERSKQKLYTAQDRDGKRIFAPTADVTILKRQFKEYGERMVLGNPGIMQSEQDLRQHELQKIRERTMGKSRGMER